MISESRHVNEQGALIIRGILADPRGGALTLFGIMEASSGRTGPFLRHTALYGAISGKRILFDVNPVRSTQTRTNNDPTNKVTGGGKVSASGAIFGGEISGGYEHGFRTGSTADTQQGDVIDIQMVWTQK